jgi:hypothetical protein
MSACAWEDMVVLCVDFVFDKTVESSRFERADLFPRKFYVNNGQSIFGRD